MFPRINICLRQRVPCDIEIFNDSFAELRKDMLLFAERNKSVRRDLRAIVLREKMTALWTNDNGKYTM